MLEIQRTHKNKQQQTNWHADHLKRLTLFLLAPCFGESQVAWLHRASFKMVSAWRDLDLSWDGLPGEACCLIGVDDEDGRTDLWITKNGGVPFTTAASPALHVQALHLGTMVNFQMRQASNCHSHLKNRGCSFLHCHRACFTSALCQDTQHGPWWGWGALKREGWRDWCSWGWTPEGSPVFPIPRGDTHFNRALRAQGCCETQGSPGCFDFFSPAAGEAI